VRHMSKSDDLLQLKASHVRVSQSGLKTDRDAMTGDICGTIM
jgi:hypothetical protein